MQSKRTPSGLPKRSPVTVLHICADNDYNGNPRRCFAVLENGTGYHVETIDEGYVGETALSQRYPWFGHSLRVSEAGLHRAYPERVYVAPKEYKRWMRREPVGDVPSVDRIRRNADRCEARA